MWPGLNLLLVLILALTECFSPVSLVFFPPQKPTLLNSNSIGNLKATGLSVARLLHATLIKQSQFKVLFKKYPNCECHVSNLLFNMYSFSGRAALQKRIMALLRQLDRQTSGNIQVQDFEHGSEMTQKAKKSYLVSSP